MSARQAKGTISLARLVRERQDFVAEWQAQHRLLINALSMPADQRIEEAEEAQRSRLAAVSVRVAEIDRTFRADFPDYAALISPEPTSVEEVREILTQNEALLLFLDAPEKKPTPDESFIWVVTKKEARWFRSDLGSTALAERVQALRCGLDDSNWGPDEKGGETR
jgi:hypothetical protein